MTAADRLTNAAVSTPRSERLRESGRLLGFPRRLQPAGRGVIPDERRHHEGCDRNAEQRAAQDQRQRAFFMSLVQVYNLRAGGKPLKNVLLAAE